MNGLVANTEHGGGLIEAPAKPKRLMVGQDGELHTERFCCKLCDCKPYEGDKMPPANIFEGMAQIGNN